jgi:hypothetical protein
MGIIQWSPSAAIASSLPRRSQRRSRAREPDVIATDELTIGPSLQKVGGRAYDGHNPTESFSGSRERQRAR